MQVSQSYLCVALADVNSLFYSRLKGCALMHVQKHFCVHAPWWACDLTSKWTLKGRNVSSSSSRNQMLFLRGCSYIALEIYILALSQMFLLKLIWRYKNEYKFHNIWHTVCFLLRFLTENLSKHWEKKLLKVSSPPSKDISANQMPANTKNDWRVENVPDWLAFRMDEITHLLLFTEIMVLTERSRFSWLPWVS